MHFVIAFFFFFFLSVFIIISTGLALFSCPLFYFGSGGIDYLVFVSASSTAVDFLETVPFSLISFFFRVWEASWFYESDIRLGSSTSGMGFLTCYLLLVLAGFTFGGETRFGLAAAILCIFSMVVICGLGRLVREFDFLGAVLWASSDLSTITANYSELESDELGLVRRTLDVFNLIQAWLSLFGVVGAGLLVSTSLFIWFWAWFSHSWWRKFVWGALVFLYGVVGSGSLLGSFFFFYVVFEGCLYGWFLAREYRWLRPGPLCGFGRLVE